MDFISTYHQIPIKMQWILHLDRYLKMMVIPFLLTSILAYFIIDRLIEHGFEEALGDRHNEKLRHDRLKRLIC